MMPWGDTGTLTGLRMFIWVAALIVGLLAAVATAAAFFGDMWWLFDYLANLRWWLFWTSLLAAVLYGMLNRGFVILVFVAAMGVNGAIIAPMWFGSQPESTGENSLHIISVDGTGGYTDRQGALNWLTGEDADLILIAGGSDVIADAMIRDGIFSSLAASTCSVLGEGFSASVFRYMPSRSANWIFQT